LQSDVADILSGRWKAFGHIDLKVDDPPDWHCDYLLGKDLATTMPGFRLDHRDLPDGADVKLIWELSRWHQLVRLAMGSYVLAEPTAGSKCIEWLEDWVVHNPPYRGWNWTSALEVGIRLIQFAWIDALLSQSLVGVPRGDQSVLPTGQRLQKLRYAILPPHLRYAWRHRSFGSSANNHLLGELAGCLVASVRWPALVELAAPLPEMQTHWEHEVLAQFAEDGGNREQALNYHLFSLEFCWYTLQALEAAGHHVSAAARERLALAGQFFGDVQVRSDPWDYGDSDSAFVSPLFSSDAAMEWHAWLEEPAAGHSIGYWLGDSALVTPTVPRGHRIGREGDAVWRAYPDSGIAVCRGDSWWLRWDVSPLGFLSTAAHGHLDALNLSVWCRGVAVVVDPGTGAYYSDTRLRAWLSSRAAHNAPCPEGEEKPRRVGPFLWAEHHSRPQFHSVGGEGSAELDLWGTRIRRRVSTLDGGHVFQVDDDCFRGDGRPAPFTVRWQFPPGTLITERADRTFSVERSGVSITVQIGEQWTAAVVDQGVVSPTFRTVCGAPFLHLTAGPDRGQGVYLRTTFLDSECA
jgi:hypothetical protein